MERFYDFMVYEFNFWTVLAPVMVLAMIVLGLGQWGVNGKKIRQFYGEKVFTVVAGVLAGVFGVLLFIESFRGIIAWLDAGLADTDANVWSVLLAPFAVMAAAMLFFIVLYYTGVGAGMAKEGYLREKRRESRKS